MSLRGIVAIVHWCEGCGMCTPTTPIVDGLCPECLAELLEPPVWTDRHLDPVRERSLAYATIMMHIGA